MTPLSRTHDHPTTSNSAHPRNFTSPAVRPWWFELALVDFRHAFWPWLVYYIAVVAIILTKNDKWPYIAAAVLLSGPAIVTRIFATDFSHDTMSALLVSPRERSAMWLMRHALATVIYGIPHLVVCVLYLLTPGPMHIGDLVHPIAIVLLLTFSYLAVGPLVVLLLRKPLLCWTAIFLLPLVIMVLWMVIGTILHLDTNSSLSSKFPYLPVGQFVFFIVIGVLAHFTSWRLWLRLEVR